MSNRSLIVLPDESAKPILDAINAAKKMLQVKMFVFSDPELLKAVVAAHQRGVKVRVMLNAARRSGEDDNKEVRKALEHAGIEVKDSNPAFGITHEKSMVVDEEIAFVKSLNWATKNLTETRDYAITTTHPHGVKEVLECFDADWHRKEFKPGLSAHLIWCPANGRERIAQFIDEAKHTLFVQNERYQDAVIIERLVRARTRGVKIHLMARPPHSLKKEKIIEGVGGLRIMDDVGIKIHKLKHLKLHGKMLLADGVPRHCRLDQPAPPAASTTGGSWPLRFTMTISWSASTRSRGTTGNTPIRLISRTRGCSWIWRNTVGGAEKLVLRMDHEHEKKHGK